MPDTNWADYAQQTGSDFYPAGQWPSQYMGGTGGVSPQQSNPGYSPNVNTLLSQVSGSGLNTSGTSGGGQPTPISGQTQAIKLSDDSTVLVDMTTGQVVGQYGNPGQTFSEKQQLQSQSEAASSARQAQSDAATAARQQNDPQNDPWRMMMPRYTAPSTVNGLRGALDIMDPNTGQLTSVRQPESPDVRVSGGNLIVPPGANAAVYYNGNKGQPTMVSGGPIPRNAGARFPSTMDLANQVSPRLQQRGQQGGMGGAGGMRGGGGAGNRFGSPGGGAGARGGLGNFAQPKPQVNPWGGPGQSGVPGPDMGGYDWQNEPYRPNIPESELGPNPNIPESELGPYPWIPQSELGSYYNPQIPESELGGY